MGKIFYVMGKSSSGKDTIYRNLMKRHPELCRVVPYTTRPVRDGEKNGAEYFFVDRHKMNEMQETGRIIEMRSYDTKCGVWTYFTADDGQINLSTDNNYLIIGTLVSYRELKNYFGGEQIIPVYIELDDDLRLERALERERSQAVPRYAEMCRRFLADEEDFSEEKLKKAGITRRFQNRDLERCLKEIEIYMGL